MFNRLTPSELVIDRLKRCLISRRNKLLIFKYKRRNLKTGHCFQIIDMALLKIGQILLMLDKVISLLPSILIISPAFSIIRRPFFDFLVHEIAYRFPNTLTREKKWAFWVLFFYTSRPGDFDPLKKISIKFLFLNFVKNIKILTHI